MRRHSTANSVKRARRRWGSAPLLMCMVWVVLSTAGGQSGVARDIEVRLALEAENNPNHFFEVAFSPDGKMLLFGDRDGGVKAWDLAEGKERFTVKKRQGEGYAKCIAFSPDNKTIALGYADPHLVRLLDASNGNKKVDLNVGKRLSCYTVAFSPDGKKLAAGGGVEEVYLWDLVTGRLCAELPAFPAAHMAHQVAFSPNSKWLAASADGDDEIILWDAAKAAKIRTIRTKPIFDPNITWQIAFSPDSKTLAVATLASGIVRLWDVPSGREKAMLHKTPADFLDLAFSPDGRTLAAVDSKKGVVHLWEVLTTKERAILHGQERNRHPLAFSPDGRTLAVGCFDGTIKLWDLAGVKRAAPDAEEVARLWASLNGDDAVAAYQAIRTLTAYPARTLPVLRKQLQRPVISAEDARKADALVAELDSDDFATREKAGKELRHLGWRAEVALHRALVRRPSLEVRRRVEAILEGVEKASAIQQLQQLRALEVLEHIGTAEACSLLKDLAKGVPEARLTREAKASLARLAKRSTPKP